MSNNLCFELNIGINCALNYVKSVHRLSFYLMSNPIYSDGFSNTDKRDKDVNAHYILRGHRLAIPNVDVSMPLVIVLTLANSVDSDER